MYIDIVPNRSSPPAILLRESFREGGKICKRTLANLSSLSASQVEGLRAVLGGEQVVVASKAFEKTRDRQHGGYQAIETTMKRIGFHKLLDSRRSRERDLVVAMVASRILNPRSKLATCRTWGEYTIAEELNIEGAKIKDLYGAMDWLFERQDRIEKKLAARHLNDGGLALYDLSSSYFEGEKCSLAKRGYSRDGKPGTLQVNYGLLTNSSGIPVSVSVFPGNTSDSTTVVDQVKKLREDFGLTDIVLVGDRGMVTQKQIDTIKPMDGTAWVTALRSNGIKELVSDGSIQRGLFDENNIFEIQHEEYPGERLIACRNADLATRRAHKREALLVSTEKELEKVRKRVEAGKLKTAADIGVKVGQVIGKYNVKKHFSWTITETSFSYSRKHEQISQEATLDGIYVIRTSLTPDRASTSATVRTYKKLCRVERAFRTIKTDALAVRPIRHTLEDRVRTHIFLCVLAYYVEWHMRDALKSVLFSDEMTEAEKDLRDPVAPAKRSPAAIKKVQSRKLGDGSEVWDFRSLLTHLGTIVRSTCRIRIPGSDVPSFELDTTPTPDQAKALALLREGRTYPVS